MQQPFEHQTKTTEFILNKHKCLITSDPGTGKTRSVIDAYSELPSDKGRMLVVAPLSILQASWGDDIEKFQPDLKYSVAYAKNRKQAFRIPRNVLTICLGKSTYARCGIIVNVTPLEPEWEGHVTLEFSNTTNLPAKIYAGEGVAQMIFFESDENCEVSYKDRDGKYQGQTGVTLPKT